MRRERTYKQIEASRNTRLWMTNVFLPTATLLTTIAVTVYNGSPEVRYAVNNKIWEVKNWFNDKFKKKAA